MVTSQPHFLLFSGADSKSEAARWHFLLESTDGSTVLEASDEEPNVRKDRLELLAVVRGLEALDQPSRVTLVTASRTISRGFRFGLEEWRNNRWCWERDGRWEPIKNHDLWQRIDQALRFHHVRCRTWRIDPAHAGPAAGRHATAFPSSVEAQPVSLWSQLRQRMARPFLAKSGRKWSQAAGLPN